MKIPKKYGYLVFCVVMFVGGYLGNFVAHILGGVFTPLGLVGGLLVFGVALYPTYYLVKRTESEW